MLNKLKAVTTKIKSIWTNLESMASKDLKELWDTCRVPLILLAALILTLKFRTIMVNLLIANSKKIYNNAQKQNQSEQLKENQDNSQANTLVQEAQNLSSTEQPVTDVDWYKKDNQ